MATKKYNSILTGTAELILNGLSNDDIALMSPEESKFSKQNMAGAIVYLSGYLSPTPTAADKKSYDYTKFCVLDIPIDTMKKFISDIVFTGKFLTMEVMLLAVECIIRSSNSVKKCLCRLDIVVIDGSKVSGVLFIFKKWLAYAISVMAKRRLVEPLSSFSAQEMRTEEMIATSIMELICAFNVIHKEKQMNVLKSKFGVDWIHIVEKTTEFATACKITDLLKSCKKASLHLEKVKLGKAEDYEPSTSLPQILSRAEEEPEVSVIEVVQTKSAVSSRNSEDIIRTKIQSKTRNVLNPHSSKPTNPVDGGRGNNDVLGNRATSYSTTSRQERPQQNERRNGTSSTSSYSTTSRQERPQQNERGNGTSSASSYSTTSRQERPRQNERGNSTSSTWGSGSTKQSGSSSNGGWDSAKSNNSQSNGGFKSTKWEGGWGSYRPSAADQPGQSSTGGWDKYKRPTDQEIAYNRSSSRSHDEIRESRDNESSGAISHVQHQKSATSSTNNGGLTVNNEKLSAPPSKGVDGLSGLPGYSSSSWKKATYNSENVVSTGRNKAPIDSHSQNSHVLNRVNLNDSPSGAVDGLSDLPAFTTWKAANNYDSRGGNSSQSSRNNFTRGHGNRTNSGFGGKRNERSDSNDQQNYKRRRVEDKAPPGRSDRLESQSIRPSAGRGRGRDRTLPAWMAKQDNGSEMKGQKDILGDSPAQIAQKALDTLNSIAPASSSVDSRGRGRGRTLPAWMTNKDSTGPIATSTPIQHVQTSRGVNQSQHSKEPHRSSNSVNSSKHSVASYNSSSAGFNGQNMGRGRGRDRTKPAWMTKSDAPAQPPRNNSNAPKTKYNAQNVAPAHPTAVDARGRGRGRTLPAWMTQKDSTSVISTASESQTGSFHSRGSASESQSGSFHSRGFSNSHNSRPDRGTFDGGGQGRGRGKTLPAWMTKK